MNELKVFEGNEVEVIERNGTVLFNPYHVGRCLDIGESTIRDHLSKMGGTQAVLLKNSDVDSTDIRKLNNAGEKFLTESGVYKLVFKSRKPGAEKFTDWIADEVLPSIRRHGAYATETTIDRILGDPDFGIRLLESLKAEKARTRVLEKEKAELSVQLDESKEWYTVKRVAKMNGLDWRAIDWRALKNTSRAMCLEVKKIFDANYGKVNAYHREAWRHEYAHLRY